MKMNIKIGMENIGARGTYHIQYFNIRKDGSSTAIFGHLIPFVCFNT